MSAFAAAKLAFAALALQELNRSGAFARLIESGPALIDEEGLRYCDCREFMRANCSDILAVSGDYLMHQTDFELLEVHSALKPHYHQHTDSVVIVLNSSPQPNDFEAVFEKHFDMKGVGGYGLWWRSLERDQTLFVPRDLTHGFRRKTGSGKSSLWLAAATYPPIAKGDTHFVE